MRALSAVASIRASVEQVWAILTDTARYQEWNAEVTRVEGTIALGGQLDIFANGQEVESFEVVDLIECKGMVLRRSQSLGVGGTRTMRIRPVLQGFVEFEIRETYSGWLADLWARRRQERLRQIHKFAADLKLRAEKPAITAEAVPESLDWDVADPQAACELTSTLCVSESILPDLGTSAGAPTPIALSESRETFCFFESPYSSTNDGLLALIAAIPPRTQDLPKVDSQGLPITTIHIGKPIERVKCANGRRRASARTSPLVYLR